MKRNNLTENEAMQKINSQFPISVKVKMSDITLENGKGLEDLRKNVTNKVIPAVYQKLGYINWEAQCN